VFLAPMTWMRSSMQRSTAPLTHRRKRKRITH
jgi:hypothetical protein